MYRSIGSLGQIFGRTLSADFGRIFGRIFGIRSYTIFYFPIRVRWIKHVEAKKRREEEEAERERVSYAQIDWHNFVVVETVDYQPWEVGNFPPPTNPTEVGARVLMQRRIESNPPPPVKNKVDEKDATNDNTNVEDMEEGSSDEEGDMPQPIGKPLMAVGKLKKN